jgi:23S rRNA (pseudouridine1915-N3)-methyltransferase
LNNFSKTGFSEVMKLLIWCIGQTDEKYLKEGIQKYLDRLKHYVKYEYTEFKDVKAGSYLEETLKREAELVLAQLKKDDYLILLDEQGKSYDSIGLAKHFEKLQIQISKNVVLLIGGAFGHHESIKQRANQHISLSKLTFSHQMVRLFLVEQIYRAFTIIKGEKYHNI